MRFAALGGKLLANSLICGAESRNVLNKGMQNTKAPIQIFYSTYLNHQFNSLQFGDVVRLFAMASASTSSFNRRRASCQASSANVSAHMIDTGIVLSHA